MKKIITVGFFVLLFSFSLQHAGAATMNDYCITPPYVGSGITPNLLLMIDNSASMYDPAYQSSTYCYDNSYNDPSSYSGYFDQATTYQYNTTTNVFSAATSSMPNNCNGGGGSASTTPYVCISTVMNGSTPQITAFYATGKFLNWLTASKFDIEKQILTGGKYDTVSGNLISETRGCAGRKFIKTVSGLSGVTFAVRGGNASLGITNQATAWGQTYLEIYNGTYQSASCKAAVTDWQNVGSTNLGTLQNDTKACVGAGSSAAASISAYNHIIHDCYWYYIGHALSNLTPVEGDCQADWQTFGATSFALITSPSLSAGWPGQITSSSAPDAICSNALTHPASAVDNNTTGFAGKCVTIGGTAAAPTYSWNSACETTETKDFCAGIGISPVTDPPSNTLTGTLQNVPGFVMEAGVYNMTMMNDFSSTGGLKGFPVKIALAPPPTGLISTYKDQIRFGAMTFQKDGSGSECNKSGNCSLTTSTSCVADSACPAGERCLFPVPCANVCSVTTSMTCFANAGSSTLTSPDCPNYGTAQAEYCGPITSTDGGKIISYVGAGNCSSTTATTCTVDNDCPLNETCVPKVGDHGTGLIKSIDDVQATSWTPLNEVFYNAIGYFARTNPYDGSNPASRNFNFTSLPISYGTTTTAGFNPSQKKCQKNNILLVTDGMSTADQNTTSEGLAQLYSSQTPAPYTGVYGYDSTNKCPSYAGSRSLPTLAWAAKNLSIKTLTTSAPASASPANAPADSSEQIYTYVVYGGPSAGPDSGTTSGLCDPYRLMNTTAANGGTTLLYASSDPSLLYTKIKSALDQVAARAASGTAASVLASGEGSGANLIQAVFYPRRRFPNSNEIAWTGRLTNLWYYVDPFFSMSSIREDDEGLTGDKILQLRTDSTHHDYITQLSYDNIKGATVAYRWNSDANGNAAGGQVTTPAAAINFEDLSSLWEAGTMLWQRNYSTRSLYTSVTGSSQSQIPFSTASLTSYPTLSDNMGAGNATSDIITWVTGSDVSPTYRSRTVSMTISGVTSTNVWKLGDVVNSTPKLASWMPLNSYHKFYRDGTYGIPGSDANLGSPADPTHFVTTQAYKNRGMIFTGGNDGMLHAFKLGTLQLKWTGQGAGEVARLVNPDTGAVCSSSDTAPCGQEAWAYIPKNALPYLKYMADPGYCHLYSVDLTPFVFDASILAPGVAAAPNAVRDVNSWRTIVIGAMRFGGACRDTASACTDCVKTPMTGAGYSSYFALDVTDQNNPTLLWEFSSAALGFATTGPAVVRIDGVVGGLPNNSTNGNWFVVIGSGPTGPISTGDHQFLGRSDQSLKLFILDLKSGNLLRTMDSLPNEPNIPNAFAGSLVGAPLDASLDYQDDVLYVPYVKKCASVKAAPSPSTRNICDDASTWTDGGVGRLVTKKDPNPANWAWSTLIDGVGPVTSAVTKLQDPINNILWVYFGTGRYYYVQTSASDDADGQRYLFGVKDPCLTASGTYNPACTTSAPAPGAFGGGPTDVTVWDPVNPPVSVFAANGSTFNGWFIRLDIDGNTVATDPSTKYMTERVVTDPLASSRGVVYFTSYKPYSNLCDLGGKSFIWALQYNTGGPPTNLKGKVLIQVSTGAIEQKDLSTAFTDAGNRKTAAMEGKPPEAQGMSAMTQPSAVRKIIHMREK